MVALLWTVTALGLALWSGAVWALWALLSHDPAWVGALREWLDASPLGDRLDHWLPGWDALLAAMIQLLQAVLHGLARRTRGTLPLIAGPGSLVCAIRLGLTGR